VKRKGKIILASSSPRRLKLLKEVDIDVEVFPPKVKEHVYEGENPSVFTSRVAREKALDVTRRKGLEKDAWIISADTTVFCAGKILNKPENESDAKRMLELMSGRTHKVITSFYIRYFTDQKENEYVESVESFVTFRKISAREIEWYVKSGEPMDKAGSYGAQGLGTIFIEKIEGSYSNVVGLPMSQLINALIKVGAIEF